jgi:signal transduction histidine kinase
VWREIWNDIEPLLSTALGGVEGTYVEEQLLIMERNGYPEETYYTFSYSPIPGANNAPGGIICANTDDTKRVVGERQLRILRDIAATTIDACSRQAAYERSALALENHPRDIPFALLYTKKPECGVWSLAGSAGLAEGHPAAPREIAIQQHSPWPLMMADERETAFFRGLSDRFGRCFPSGGWDRPCDRAAILMIPEKGDAREGRLIVGLNPCRLYDESYRSFLELVAGQISVAVTSADAYEEERRRSEALAELDRAKTVFFSNVSHEFRTPLTLMLGPLHDLLFGGEPLSPQIRQAAEAAHRNGLRLLRMVNSLLDFSRMEAGRLRATYSPVDLGAFSAEVASSFRSAIEGAGLTLRIASSPLPGVAYVDREMWEKILLNLLSNAFKFTLQGEIALMVEPSADGLRAIVRVSDTGVGIPPEELPRLFERFHRIEGQKGRSIEGSGIGLALVNDLVKLHGGEITVESAPGRGTAFTLDLPLGRSHLPADRVRVDAAETIRAPIAHEYLAEVSRWRPCDDATPTDLQTGAHLDLTPSAPRLEPGRIVLADDNADMRDYVTRLVGGSCQVRAVGDGEAALEAIRSEPPDLIITDVMMPRLDGFGLLRAIRSAAETRELPVILLSARAGEEARIEGLDAGADDYLVKPFSANELVARVNANLKLARIRREARAALERSEERLRELNAQLEERVACEVAERTKVEDALRQAQKMEAIGQLTGGVAHDFNNLLTLIIGGLEIIRRAGPGDQARIERGVAMSLQGAQRAAALTGRLLAFARRQSLEPKPLDLNVLVRDMTEILHRTLGEHIELEGVLAPRLWLIEADQNQLENAILNLAVNARDAMPDGGRLTIETANAAFDDAYAGADAEVVPGQYAVVAISDTGAGMSPEVKARAFDPFFTTKEPGQGTGLGLSMVYGFVKQSGGHVTIYSEPGQGTTAKLYFPRYYGDGELRTIRAERYAPLGGANEAVLVLEDNHDVRAYSVMILTELGYRVFEAANGEDALEILRSEERADLLFSDVVLPGKSGKVVAEQALALRPRLKVLFTTGYSRNAIVHHGRLDSGVQLIQKPFTLEQLARRVRVAGQGLRHARGRHDASACRA